MASDISARLPEMTPPIIWATVIIRFRILVKISFGNET
jgi:hypothetical protein